MQLCRSPASVDVDILQCGYLIKHCLTLHFIIMMLLNFILSHHHILIIQSRNKTLFYWNWKLKIHVLICNYYSYFELNPYYHIKQISRILVNSWLLSSIIGCNDWDRNGFSSVRMGFRLTALHVNCLEWCWGCKVKYQNIVQFLTNMQVWQRISHFWFLTKQIL